MMIKSPKDVMSVLKDVHRKYHKAQMLFDRVDNLRSRAEKGYGYSVSAGHGDGIGDGVAALADTINKYNKAVDILQDAINKADRLISLIDDERVRCIMHDRYISFDPWSDIACRYDMTHDEILHLDHNACKKIYNIINN